MLQRVTPSFMREERLDEGDAKIMAPFCAKDRLTSSSIRSHPNTRVNEISTFSNPHQWCVWPRRYTHWDVSF